MSNNNMRSARTVPDENGSLGNSHIDNNNISYIQNPGTRYNTVGTVPSEEVRTVPNGSAGTVPADLTDILHTIISQLRELNIEYKKNRISYSELAYCLRASYYGAIYGKEITDKILLGIDKHDWTERHMAELLSPYFKCTSEYSIEYNNIKGRIDLLCTDSNNNAYVIELKFSSNATHTNPLIPFYIRQLKYYMASLYNQGYKNVSGILLLMSFNYETHYIKILQLDPNEVEEILSDLEKRAKILMQSKQTNTPPMREKGNWCNICGFRSICFNESLI